MFKQYFTPEQVFSCKLFYSVLKAVPSTTECTKNKALDKGKDNKSESVDKKGHFARKDFKYVTPVLKKDVMTDQVSNCWQLQWMSDIVTNLVFGQKPNLLFLRATRRPSRSCRRS